MTADRLGDSRLRLAGVTITLAAIVALVAFATRAGLLPQVALVAGTLCLMLIGLRQPAALLVLFAALDGTRGNVYTLGRFVHHHI